MKSDLQIRCEKAAERFKIGTRKPVIIEFAGVPKAGKTTILNQLQSFLKRCGFKVEVEVERASVCPIRDKKHANFNVWTACTTLANILEKTQDPPRSEDPDILILDRGIFDSICWLKIMERTARIHSKERQLITDFLMLDDWKSRISAVIVMTALPEDSMKREKGLLPVEGVTGSIMNEKMLSLILETTKEAVNEYKSDFRILQISTSNGSDSTPTKTAEKVADFVLNIIEWQLQESVLTLPKSSVNALFKGSIRLQSTEATDLVNAFLTHGKYEPRADAEKNNELLQALPIVVVRNKNGSILKLKRKEKLETNPLHGELVIWAGGHVREEDSKNGDPIKHCALRELHEELRLSVEAKDLKLMGSIFSDTGANTSRHVAIVYEWNTNREDVDLALCTAEFFERTGTSLSGKFVSLEELTNDVNSRTMREPWSEEIIRSFLATGDMIIQKGLF